MIRIFLALLFIVGCSKSAQSPEELLTNILEERQKGPLSREFVMDHTTGELRDNFKEIPAEQFPLIVFGGKHSNGKLKVLRKNCNGDKCILTYLVSFDTKLTGAEFSSSVKKIAQIIKEDGEWLLSDVTNVKTYHEAKNAIDINKD
jgi:hypothetical protein